MATVSLWSCKNNQIREEIERLQSHPISMTACEHTSCYKAGENVMYSDIASPYKLVIYIDSLSCSSCFISHMTEYEECVQELSSNGIETIFIFEPDHNRREEVTSLLKEYAYPFWTVVIADAKFSTDNPHLPSMSTLKSFLLNAENEVVIVGNPTQNSKIKELMLKSLQKE